MDHKLLLATLSTLEIYFAEETTFTNWPGIEGQEGHDDGNYISVLLLAWAYILSAKWAELLQHSTGHDCVAEYISLPDSLTSRKEVAIDMSDEFNEEEIHWWNVILAGNKGWKICMRYNNYEYTSPWSISVLDKASIKYWKNSNTKVVCLHSPTLLSGICRGSAYTTTYTASVQLLWPQHFTFHYSEANEFPCQLHNLPPREESPRLLADLCGNEYTKLVASHGSFLPCYMSLSTNPWGMRSLLCSSFFNPDIPCNLVSAWLNPAFSVLDPFIKARSMDSLAAIYARQQPRLVSLWLGALVMGVAEKAIRELKNGLTALNLHAAAWTGCPLYDRHDLSSQMLSEGATRGIFWVAKIHWISSV